MKEEYLQEAIFNVLRAVELTAIRLDDDDNRRTIFGHLEDAARRIGIQDWSFLYLKPER